MQKPNSKTMKSKDFSNAVVEFWTTRVKELLQERNNLSRDDLEYVVTKVEPMRDERLKQCVASLVGWGDDERAELETFCAIALEVMKDSTPSRLRTCAERVELRYHLSQPLKKES